MTPPEVRSCVFECRQMVDYGGRPIPMMVWKSFRNALSGRRIMVIPQLPKLMP